MKTFITTHKDKLVKFWLAVGIILAIAGASTTIH